MLSLSAYSVIASLVAVTQAPSLVDSARFEVYRLGRDVTAFVASSGIPRATIISRARRATLLVRRLQRAHLAWCPS